MHSFFEISVFNLFFKKCAGIAFHALAPELEMELAFVQFSES